MSVGRVLRTARHLQARQVANRITRRFRPLPPWLGAAAPHRLREGRTGRPKLQVADNLAAGDGFRFLNRTRSFSGEDRWRPTGVPALWVYQLHYFQYLFQLPEDRARFLIEDWMTMNPAGASVAWDPYPTSLRVREWIEWLVTHRDCDTDFVRRVVESIVEQALVLESRLEYHLMANHLLENAISLCWLGLSLDGPLAERWRRKGHRLSRTEVGKQVLADGAHFERSPMYQSSIAESLLRLAAVAGKSSVPEAGSIEHLARSAGDELLSSLRFLCHPDGDFALLNDCALGQAPSEAALRARYGGDAVESPGAGVWRLAEAGFLGWQDREGSFLVLDGGDMLPSYNPGHVHTGMLSFELSLHGRRVVTDTGVSTYEPGPERLYQRGTAAHSTIQVDDVEQSEIWAAFRCGRRARIVEARSETGQPPELVAGYEGTLDGRQRVRHTRRIRIERRELRFHDVLRARGRHSAKLRLHLAPGLRLVAGASGSAICDESGSRLATVAGAQFVEGRSPYHAGFGREVERCCLEAEFSFRDAAEVDWLIAFSGADGT